MRVEPVPMEALTPRVREIAEGGHWGVSDDMIRMFANAPRYAELFVPLYYGLWFDTKFDARLRELARLAIAKDTGCVACASGRDPEAIEAGMTEEEVGHLEDPANGPFSNRDKAALVFAQKFGSDHLSIGDDEFEALHEHFTDEEIIELGLLCMMWLGGGRFSKVFQVVPEACEVPAPALVSATVGAVS